MLTIGSLFSGIGGLELGLEWAGLGPVLWQVEKDPFCRAVLAKHWPTVERYDDVCQVGATNLAAVRLVCGGFPCTDVSTAGKGAGLDGPQSGLWSEYRRIIGELRPDFVIVENVASGKARWLPIVRREMHLLGYGTRALGIAARDVGAPHLRRRVFVVAHAYSYAVRDGAERLPGRRAPAIRGEGQALAVDAGRWPALPDIRRSHDGVSAELDDARLHALGNSVVPQCAEIVGKVIRQML